MAFAGHGLNAKCQKKKAELSENGGFARYALYQAARCCWTAAEGIVLSTPVLPLTAVHRLQPAVEHWVKDVKAATAHLGKREQLALPGAAIDADIAKGPGGVWEVVRIDEVIQSTQLHEFSA